MKPQTRYKTGDKIGGCYLVHQALMGGMGEVYLCLDLETNQPIALKTFQGRYLTNPKLRAAFNREVAIWIKLEKHPNIVRCFYILENIDNQPFIALEWIANIESRSNDLRGWLRYGPMNLRMALDFTIDICRGLIHAQKKQPGIVHRDLKPDNVLIGQERTAKITDFGLAKTVQDADMEIYSTRVGADDRQSLFGVGGVVGTPPYMAPEQWRDEKLDARTDIYAVGCILYEMLAGRVPFTATDLKYLRQQHLESTIPVLSDSNDLPTTLLNPLLASCLAKRREDRFRTVKDLLQQIEKIYEQTFAKAPKSISITGEFTAVDHMHRSITYKFLERYDEALSDGNQAIELDPTLPDAYCNRGVIYEKLELYDKALEDYSQAIELKPTYALAYNNRGVIYTIQKRYDEALKNYGRAIRFDPTLVLSYINRGSVYANLKQYDEAIVDLNLAIEINPRLTQAYINRGLVYEKMKKYEDALADYSRVVELDPALAGIYSTRGKIFAILNRYPEALADYNQAIELDPTLAGGYSNRGSIYTILKRYDEAFADYNKAIELDSTNAAAHSGIGILLSNRDQLEDALIHLKKAINLAPDNSDELRGIIESTTMKIKVKSLIKQGDIMAESGKYHEALACFEEAKGLDPENELVFYNIGVCKMGIGNIEDALASFNRSTELNPGMVQVWSNKGMLLAHLGRTDEALSSLEHACHLDPGHAKAWLNRGGILMSMERLEEALQCFDRALEADPGYEKAQEARQMCQNMMNAKTNPFQLATQTFLYTSSIDAMRKAVAKFPVMKEPGFIAAINQARVKQVTSVQQAVFEQRIAWLYQIISEQGDVKQTSSIESEPDSNSIQRGIQAFMLASSLDGMRRVAFQFPFITDANFEIVWQDIMQKVPSERKPYFEQRLGWLRQITNEKKK